MPRSTSGSPSALISQSKTATRRPRSIRVEHHVIELEVAVHDRRPRGIRRQMRRQPRRERNPCPACRRLRAMPALGPAADLTLDEAGRFTQVRSGRARRRRWRGDRRACRSSPRSRGAARRADRQRGRLLGADHDAAPPLHHVEDAPITSMSSHRRYGLGASGNTGCIAASQRYSRAMSCAVGGTGPNGGRRSTNSTSPKRSR